MVVAASVTGLIRTLLIIIGVFVLLRFLGQLMNAKRNMEEERALNERERKLREEKARKKKNLGKTNVIGKNKGGVSAEDVDFEEVE
jgi:hypothetical protein